jgi:hypothetical protein
LLVPIIRERSKVLSEIQQRCNTGEEKSTEVLLDDLAFVRLKPEIAAKAIEHLTLKQNPQEEVAVDHVIIGARGQRQQVPSRDLFQYVQNPTSHVWAFCNWFLRFTTLLLDGRSRINLVMSQSGGDLQMPQSSLQVLFVDDPKRHEVRRIVADAFGVYFVIDPTALGQLRIRLSRCKPSSDSEERGLHQEAVTFHANAQPIEEASDGVKAFTGIIT